MKKVTRAVVVMQRRNVQILIHQQDQRHASRAVLDSMKTALRALNALLATNVQMVNTKIPAQIATLVLVVWRAYHALLGNTRSTIHRRCAESVSPDTDAPTERSQEDHNAQQMNMQTTSAVPFVSPSPLAIIASAHRRSCLVQQAGSAAVVQILPTHVQ